MPSTPPAFSACHPDRRGDAGARLPVLAHVPSYQDLATGRRWHFFFAWLFVINGLVYLAYSLVERPSGARPRADAARSFAAHRRVDPRASAPALPEGRGGADYNVLQKLAYLG